jgi:hypothetical protein
MVNGTNRAGLSSLFGPAAEHLVNPDQTQGAAELAEFAKALNATNRLVPQTDSRMVLELGMNSWPFPIPLVKAPGGWQFDTQAGLEELLNRRIGRNELDVLQVMKAYVEAQREYASRDRDGDQVLEFAQKITSSEGRTDGLYWPPELNGEVSPLGPLVADAQYDYVINGNMIAGFALVVWPAAYGDSGIMTFIVNQQGRVYQQDLGPDTSRIVRKMNSYDPDGKWHVSED